MLNNIAYALGGQPQVEGAEAGPAAMLTSFMPLVFIMLIFYFLIIRPNQKRNKAHREMITNLRVGDPVMTNSGFYGRIVEFIDNDQVVIDLGEVNVTVTRSALNLMPQNHKSPVPQAKKTKKKDKRDNKAEASSDDDNAEE